MPKGSLPRPDQPAVLLASTVWWPLSARLATRFVRYGFEVSAICPRGHVLGHVAGMRRLYDTNPFDAGASLERAIEDARPDLVVPCDDRVVSQLHELHERRPHLRDLIVSSLGPASEYGIVSRRERLLETAASLGIRIPDTQLVRSEDDVRAWFARGPARSVLKVEGTWGGNGVRIVDSYDEAIAAHARLRKRGGLVAAVKRLVVNRDPLAIWGWRRGGTPTITIQQFVDGRPSNAMLACWRGEVLASVTAEVLSAQGATGAGLVVRLVDNTEIHRAARLLAERLSLTGFYGLDFVIEAGTGSAYLIEMNPRCTQLGHLVLPRRGDLVAALCAKLSGNRPRVEPSAPIENDVVAFFPQALLADPHSRLAFGAHLDVPWEHPELVRELLLPSWPERQWISRLYHRLRPPQPTPTVDFPDRPVVIATSLSDSGRAS
jgi:hypothetical protein